MSGWPRALRRIGIEIALLVAFGVLMAVLGPYGTIEAPVLRRWIYWLAAIVGGGGIGIAIDRLLMSRVPQVWRRVGLTSVAMTPPVMALVVFLNAVVIRFAIAWRDLLQLSWRVFVISLLITAVRALVWRSPAVVVETRTVIAPPLPEAEALFRQRLPARTRGARLIAVEAYDHYLRVHTDAGVELITARFTDALDELAGAYGYRTHRSWWIAAEAIEAVRWSRGSGTAVLAGGTSAPVSRTQAPVLRAAGW